MSFEVESNAELTFQNLLRLLHVSVLISGHQARHSDDLRVVLVPARQFLPHAKLRGSRLGLLRVEGVDFAPHEHVCKNQVLQHLDPLRRARLVVLPERLKQVGRGLLPRLCIVSLKT